VGIIALLTCFSGLKQTINREGTWRIRKQEKSSVIEVFQVEEQGHGDILSPAFKAWRTATGSMES
jgi:RAT1-interacting protein